MPELRVITVGDPEGFTFYGTDAKRVFDAINIAGAIDAGWANAKLTNGMIINFVMRNVSYFSYKDGESHDN